MRSRCVASEVGGCEQLSAHSNESVSHTVTHDVIVTFLPCISAPQMRGCSLVVVLLTLLSPSTILSPLLRNPSSSASCSSTKISSAPARVAESLASLTHQQSWRLFLRRKTCRPCHHLAQQPMHPQETATAAPTQCSRLTTAQSQRTALISSEIRPGRLAKGACRGVLSCCCRSRDVAVGSCCVAAVACLCCVCF